MRKYVEKMNSLNKLLLKYNDEASLKALAVQKEKVGDMLAAMHLDEKGRDKNSKYRFLLRFLLPLR